MATSTMRPGDEAWGRLPAGSVRARIDGCSAIVPAADEGQRVGEVEEPPGHVDEVDVGEHVQRVADEHARHGGEQEPVRRDAVLLGAEGDAHRDHDQEDRHRPGST